MAGRPRGQSLDPSRASSVRSFSTEIEERWRLRIPLEAKKGLPWLESQTAVDLLGELRRPGVIILRAWDPHGLAAVTVLESLEAQAQADPTFYTDIAAHELIYVRLTLGADGMITLPEPVLLHLRTTITQNRLAMVARSPAGIEIWGSYGRDVAALEGNI